MLRFGIALETCRTVEVGDKEKKYVAYMLQVRQDSDVQDPNPSKVERRYNQFLDLYTGLKKEFPTLVSHINFPKKALMGNFDQNLILTRISGFKSLLDQVASESKLRETLAAIKFFSVELEEAKRLLAENKYDLAFPVLETSLKLLNKIYTDHSHVVLLTLCRLVACGAGRGPTTLAWQVERWASLALHRYKGVSDSDLLQLYVPLLQTCIYLWEILARDTSQLVTELNDMKKRGMKVDVKMNLMDAINALEEA